MTRKQRANEGTRNFGGRHYLLANRGAKTAMDAQAVRERASGQYARVVPWNPFYQKALRDTLDDYALFTFPKEAKR